ncbi:glycosyltransferase family 25 protein [Acidisphaera sp. L21]|uniref:glycosyltransferase family 25 protein n=1 Tax=Acidisphaera sp. L21 TaxID=1641851 RepID=UPI00131C42BD|nr:glycosyltransferase family 25 protein [Acidisphaera sp. L21]
MRDLKWRALAAREAGQPTQAVALWRQVLQESPDDWRIALELKADLTCDYRYSEADPAFRRAAQSFPDAEWLAHYGSLFTFHSPDLPALIARAEAILGRRPGNRDVHRLLGDLLMQHRQWPAAEHHLALAEQTEESAAKLALVRLYLRLSAPADGTGPPYEIAYINLDRSADRRADVVREFADSPVTLRRVPAVEGRMLPEPAVRRLVGSDEVLRGTLGCFLSHVSAWETMLARGVSYCMVIEDDVVPQVRLPAHLGAFSLPAAFDVCFINRGMQPRWPAARVSAAAGFEAIPLIEAFASFPVNENAPGTDAYLLSAAGARKLLDWVAADGFAADVDWRVLAYSISEAECAALPSESFARGLLHRLHGLVGRPERLDSYVLHPALMRTVAVSSEREDDNRHRRG